MLKNAEKLIGANQVRKAVKTGRVAAVYIAEDADRRVTEPIRALCAEAGVELKTMGSMKELGAACGIEVGAAAAAILKE